MLNAPHALSGEPHPSGTDDPRRWLASTPLLDLDDPKLRLKSRALTQLSKTPREKALAIYGFVKRLPIVRGLKTRFRTAREVIEAGSGDADEKATVFVALLRAAGIPARVRYVELHGDLLRGLMPRIFARAARPVVEIWLGRWVRTDTYIFDAAYMAAARQRLKDHGWPCGYGITVNGYSLWNGVDDAFLSGAQHDSDPYAIRRLAAVSDPQELVASPEWRATHRLLARALLWNVISRRVGRVYRELREESSQGAVVSRHIGTR